MNAEILLRIDGLSVNYGRVKALHDVSLLVGKGEAVALIGANGAGKSTIFKTVMGLLKPHKGTIALAGRPLGTASPQRRARLGLGYSPEGRRVFPGLTVRENLEVAVFGASAERRTLVDKAFDLFPALGTRCTSYGWQLSGGQQQMLAIARALMGRPRLLLLDEPSLGLSPKLADEVMRATHDIIADGTSVLLAEQNVARSLASCDRAYVLDVGRVALSGPSDALRDNDAVKKAYLGG
jgi:branched-chain amino acid transport system ATP-binding protein